MQAVNLFQATKPELQVSAVRWRGVRAGEESSEHRHELSLQTLALIGRKGLLFIGFIHCLAARETASVRKKGRGIAPKGTRKGRG